MFAEAAEGISIGAWIVTSCAAEQTIIEKIGVVNLEQRVEQEAARPEVRIEVIAKRTNVDTKLTPIACWLVEGRRGSEELVSIHDLEQGVRFSYGGLLDIEQPRLEAALEWNRDAHPAIHRWASRLVEDLGRIVRRYRESDEEERLIREIAGNQAIGRFRLGSPPRRGRSRRPWANPRHGGNRRRW